MDSRCKNLNPAKIFAILEFAANRNEVTAKDLLDAKLFGCSTRTIERYLNELASVGFLELIKEEGKGGGKKHSYKFSLKLYNELFYADVQEKIKDAVDHFKKSGSPTITNIEQRTGVNWDYNCPTKTGETVKFGDLITRNFMKNDIKIGNDDLGHYITDPYD